MSRTYQAAASADLDEAGKAQALITSRRPAAAPFMPA